MSEVTLLSESRPCDRAPRAQAGVGISNDALKLRRDYGLRCAGLLDLSQLAARTLADGARPWCRLWESGLLIAPQLGSSASSDGSTGC